MDAQTMARAPRTNIRAQPRDRRPHRASGETAATASDAGQTGLVSSPGTPQRWPAEGRAVTTKGIVVNGRNVAVPDHFRMHVAAKMAHVHRYDNKISRYRVELFHEKNRRQSKLCQRIQITGTGHGPVVRAAASGPDFLRGPGRRARQARDPATPQPQPTPGAPRPSSLHLSRRGHRNPDHIARRRNTPHIPTPPRLPLISRPSSGAALTCTTTSDQVPERSSAAEPGPTGSVSLAPATPVAGLARYRSAGW